MQKAMIKTNVEIEKFRFLQEKVDKIVLEKQQEEVDYGEIPEEFKGQIISVIRKGVSETFSPLFLMNELNYMYMSISTCINGQNYVVLLVVILI